MLIKVVRQKRIEPKTKLMRFDGAIDLSGKSAKTFKVIKDADGNVIDYKEVKLAGYLSTFQHVTPSDRDGDYVLKGAFLETIPKFMRNPVMLVNHYYNVRDVAGVFTKIAEDDIGLKVEGILSESPGNIDIRFKVAEGILRTLSMGGMFHYLEDGRGIFKVDLWEGSLVAIPSNPDATFSVREPTETEMKAVLLDG